MPKLGLAFAAVLAMGLCFTQSGACAQTAGDAPSLAAELPEAGEKPEAPVGDIDHPGAGGLVENDPRAGGLSESDPRFGGRIEMLPDEGAEMPPSESADMLPDEGAEMPVDEGTEMLPDEGAEMPVDEGAEMPPDERAEQLER